MEVRSTQVDIKIIELLKQAESETKGTSLITLYLPPGENL